MKQSYLKKSFLALSMVLFMALGAQAEVKTTDNMVWYRVHFGLGVGASVMNPEKMTSFIDKEVTPRFPLGLTVTMSRGQWTSPKGGVIKERTVVVDLQAPAGEAGEKALADIATAYLKIFGKAKVSVFVVRVSDVQTQLWYQ